MPQLHNNLNEQICRRTCELAESCMWMNTVGVSRWLWSQTLIPPICWWTAEQTHSQDNCRHHNHWGYASTRLQIQLEATLLVLEPLLLWKPPETSYTFSRAGRWGTEMFGKRCRHFAVCWFGSFQSWCSLHWFVRMISHDPLMEENHQQCQTRRI